MMRRLRAVFIFLAFAIFSVSILALLTRSLVPAWVSVASLAASSLFLGLQPTVRVLVVRVLVPVLVGLALFLIFDYANAFPGWDAVRHAFEGDSELDLMVEIFNATVSTIYAILVAFMVFKSMQDHDNINITLRDEAMQLDAMSKILSYMNGNGRSNTGEIKKINELFVEYAGNILDDRFRASGHMKENQILLDGVWAAIGRLRIETENERVAFDQLISRIDKLTSLRSSRIAYMLYKPSPFMLLMLIVLSAVVIAPFYLPFGGTELVSPYFAACLGFVLSFLFFMMVDMSSHFDGYWQIDRTPFEDSRKSIEGRMHANPAS